jgi:Chondroitinase B
MMQEQLVTAIRLTILVLNGLFVVWSMQCGPQISVHYVSTAGSDSDDGSAAHPFATIQHADTVSRPGDAVIVLDGTYKGDIIIASSGTSRHPITYKAQNKWQVRLVGSGIGDGSAVIRVRGAHIIIQGFDVTGSDANGIILAYSGTTASYNQAVGNYVHDIITPCDSNSGTAIETGGGDNYSGITHNDMIGNLVVNITPYNGCPGGHAASGLYAQIPYSVIANNIVINAGYAIQSWHAASHVTVFGNTLINNLRPITIGDGDSPGGVTNDYSLVQNNIIYNSTNTAIAETGATGPHNQYIDNLIYGGNTRISLNHGLHATGTINADPKFVNNTGTAAGSYHLQSNSPALGTGLALTGVATDFNGAARPQSGATVIGACLGVGTT